MLINNNLTYLGFAKNGKPGGF